MTSVYEIAEEFIQHTDCSVFITGKAGSGKTTLLRHIKEGALKQTAIVAPTGVAAINAEGTTIHSLFQLPFSPFIPTNEGRHHLIANQQMSAVRRKLLRELELLIIDEISMVRADLLDAVDTILRHYRFRFNEPFGGVQVVYIGDMYQLPPVCVGEEWELLRQYYKSPYFFHSQAVIEQPPIYIELDKIFRQTNLQFINLLNEVRNNQLSPDTLQLLNMRYKAGFRATKGDGYITLTTHNASADAINNDEISKIDAPYFNFTARVKDEFPEKCYPTDLELQLKEGAKVMFIANDMSQPRRYYNGKIGTITDLTDDEIWVTCDGETDPILVAHEVWENKSYTLNHEGNKIEEKLLGSFTQYPLRLAWAITIHKSQGLTFDRVVIDAGAAFASGQVYVALSRCRSLDGIILTSPINPHSLTVDPNIVQYGENRLPNTELEAQVEIFKQQYSVLLLLRLFSMEELMSQTTAFYNYISKIIADFNEETNPFVESLKTQVSNLYSVALRFQSQLRGFDHKNETARIQERVRAASGYYVEQLTDIIALIESSPATTESKTEAQDYTERLKTIFETTYRLKGIITAVADDMSVTNIFATKQSIVTPKFHVKAYVADKEVKLLKTDHPVLYSRLAYWRNHFCKEHDLPVYTVFSNATLVELSNKLPYNANQLIKIKGFGNVKVSKYGNIVLEIISQYCDEVGIDLDTQSAINFSAEENTDNTHIVSEKKNTEKDKINNTKKDKIDKKHADTEPSIPKTNTIDQTLELFKEGLNIEDVAKQRSLTPSTIYNHAAKLIHEKRVMVQQFVSEDTLQQVMTELLQKPEQSNTELFELFGGSISFDDLRLIRAYQMSQEIF